MSVTYKLLVLSCVILARSLAAQPSLVVARGLPDEVGPNYNLWNGNGTGSPGHTHRLMEIGSGMHYWDGNQWSDSEAVFTPTTNGFVANKVQDKVMLQGDLSIEGAVNVVTLNGLRLSSTPVGIALYDPVSGNEQVIATITNSTGVLISSNQVFYPDCFNGGVCADMVYTLEKGSFSQDVVFKGRMDPTEFGFPTNSRIQILTEFYQAPAPISMSRPLYVETNQAVRLKKVSPDLVDQVLSFDEFVIGTGNAYTYPSAANTNGTQAVVAKEFKVIQGRAFLIESVDSPDIRRDLLTLPPCAGGTASSGMIYRAGKAPAGYACIPKARAMSAKSARLEQKRQPKTASLTKTGRVQ